MKISLLAEGLDVSGLVAALDEHPEFWDLHTGRTAAPESPHHGLSDIYVRYVQFGDDPSRKHDAVWYPCADVLPVRQLIYPLMTVFQGDILGGVLITRIKPGQVCKPHIDTGWHAQFYEKFAIQLKANGMQEFHVEDQVLVTKPGDLFTFDNSYMHWVTNDSDEDRITLIVCLRRNQKAREA
jgi:hypothetical protein